MAWEDRDYYRGGGGGGSYGGGGGGAFRGGISANLPPATLWLLIITVAATLVDSVLTGSARGDVASPRYWGYFSADRAFMDFQVWRPVTYQFLHGGVFHLLFNMIGLWIFGRMMESWWGSKRFVAFYLISGIGGASLFALVSLVEPVAGVRPTTPLIGASGAVLGLVAGCMVKYGRQPIGLLFIPIQFTIFALGAIYIGLDVLNLLAGSAAAGSAVAHLGGALTGFVLIKQPRLLGWADRVRVPAARDITEKVDEKRRQRMLDKEHHEQKQVDAILDKVRDQGLQSLTRKEQKTLKQATDRQRRVD
jgi:membrane associated rhomboid family serine protease